MSMSLFVPVIDLYTWECLLLKSIFPDFPGHLKWGKSNVEILTVELEKESLCGYVY